MATVYKNAGLKMVMQSALAAAKVITAATNAAPGVFTSTAHGYVDGDFVLLKVNGMREVNFGVFEIYASAANTFSLKGPTGVAGLDTTSFGAFTDGTAEKVTFGTSITGVQEFSPSGGEPKYVDSGTVHDFTDKQEVVGSTPINWSMTMQWDPTDVAQIAMKTAFKTDSPKAFKVTWPNGTYAAFYGSVGFSGAPGGGKQSITTSPAAISAKGDMTFSK